MSRWDLNDKKDIEKISKRIKIAFQKYRKSPEDQEDAIQEILLWFISGKHQHSTIEQTVIDYLRKRYGNTRASSHSSRQKLEHADTLESAGLQNSFGYAYGGESQNGRLIAECQRSIGDKIDKFIFGLFYSWGLSEAEIGNLAGVSASRISQRLTGIQKRLSARIAKKEGFQISGDASQKMEGILCQETKRYIWAVGEVAFERMEGVKSFGLESFNEKSF